MIFGGAVLREGEFVYIFGGDSRPEAKKAGVPNGLVVARVAADAVRRLRAMALSGERRVAGGLQEGHARLPQRRQRVFSVSWLPARKAYAAVYSEGIGGRILLRLAPALAGPWGDPVLVYRCPEMDWPSKAFCYAAKAHPELASAPDELLITYAANSWDFWDLFKDARLYWPRFVRVNAEHEVRSLPCVEPSAHHPTHWSAAVLRPASSMHEAEPRQE